VLTRAYSRGDDFDADAFAGALLKTAGGDALAGKHLLDELAQETSGQSIGVVGNYFATHPPLIKRSAHLRARTAGLSTQSSASAEVGAQFRLVLDLCLPALFVLRAAFIDPSN
jgi:predicted Zn-dependent protease